MWIRERAKIFYFEEMSLGSIRKTCLIENHTSGANSKISLERKKGHVREQKCSGIITDFIRFIEKRSHVKEQNCARIIAEQRILWKLSIWVLVLK